MRRQIKRLVSKIDKSNRYVFFIVLILICILAIILGIYAQFFYKYSDTDPLMIGINITSKKTQEEYDLLRSDFNNLFDNTLKTNGNEGEKYKKDSAKDIVYTAYDLVNEDEPLFSVDAQIPIINIDTDYIKEINAEIKNEYYTKANSVMRQSTNNTIYKVSYTAYVNANILSIAIKSSLKEEGKSEKATIKTYNYDLGNEKSVSLNDLIELKQTSAEAVQKDINAEIKKSYENAKSIATEYGSLYERDLNSSIYKIENSDNYFLTNDGYVYIVYPYGNSDDTNEMDIVIF